jgi:hypothetical protein
MAKKGYISSFYPNAKKGMRGQQAGGDPPRDPDGWKRRASFIASLDGADGSAMSPLTSGKTGNEFTSGGKEYSYTDRPGTTGQTSSTGNQDLHKQWTREETKNVKPENALKPPGYEQFSTGAWKTVPDDVTQYGDYKAAKAKSDADRFEYLSKNGILKNAQIKRRKTAGETNFGSQNPAAGYNYEDLKRRLAANPDNETIKGDEREYMELREAVDAVTAQAQKLKAVIAAYKQKIAAGETDLEQRWDPKGTRRGQIEGDKVRHKLKEYAEDMATYEKVLAEYQPKVDEAQAMLQWFLDPRPQVEKGTRSAIKKEGASVGYKKEGGKKLPSSMLIKGEDNKKPEAPKVATEAPHPEASGAAHRERLDTMFDGILPPDLVQWVKENKDRY